MSIPAPRSSAASIIRISPSTPRRPALPRRWKACSRRTRFPGARRPRAAHDDYLAWTEKATPQPGGVNLGEIVVWLRQNLPEDAFITTGAGNFSAWVHRFYRFRKFATHIGPTSGSMGYGVPSALGIKRAFPERTVVCFSGDGDFLMNGQEFATAVQYDLPIIVVIADNGTYGTIRMHQEREYPTRVVGTELKNPDFAAYAKAFGGFGVTVEKTADFAAAFQRRGKIRQARDHPPQGRHQRLDAGADAGRRSAPSRWPIQSRRANTVVTPGLDPGVHHLRKRMDCRVKPGNNAEG